MKYKTKEWGFEAFEWEPHGLKPDWWVKMIENGQAHEFHKIEHPYALFGDKRSDHKAYVGDYIVRDVFGRIDVYSARNFQQRAKAYRDARAA